ncbi:MAG: hypothetical protein K2X94_04775 [Amoebophilaceae bacterium]|nr:hypothetical protein [Amoebophilaceae bacterium]
MNKTTILFISYIFVNAFQCGKKSHLQPTKKASSNQLNPVAVACNQAASDVDLVEELVETSEEPHLRSVAAAVFSSSLKPEASNQFEAVYSNHQLPSQPAGSNPNGSGGGQQNNGGSGDDGAGSGSGDGGLNDNKLELIRKEKALSNLCYDLDRYSLHIQYYKNKHASSSSLFSLDLTRLSREDLLKLFACLYEHKCCKVNEGYAKELFYSFGISDNDLLTLSATPNSNGILKIISCLQAADSVNIYLTDRGTMPTMFDFHNENQNMLLPENHSSRAIDSGASAEVESSSAPAIAASITPIMDAVKREGFKARVYDPLYISEDEVESSSAPAIAASITPIMDAVKREGFKARVYDLE